LCNLKASANLNLSIPFQFVLPAPDLPYQMVTARSEGRKKGRLQFSVIPINKAVSKVNIRNLLLRHEVRRYLLAALCVLIICCPSFAQSNAFIRINQIGYLASDTKIGIAFSKHHGREVLS
jgi:hypothetical protein